MSDRKSNNSKVSVEDALAEFLKRQPGLASFCERTKSLIEVSLQEAGIRYQSVQARVKTESKLKKKYLDPIKNYTKLDDITDLAGLRVITYYEDEVDLVGQILEREFNIDHKDSVDKRDTAPDRFGYRAINYVCSHSDRRVADVEYRRFAGIKCEVQVTSVLGHAWSEIEHEWYDLREAYPDEVKRRFSIIAAIFELANREFVDIRKSKTQYERSVALQVEADVADVRVDAVSLRTFTEQEPVVAEIDSAVARALRYRLISPSDIGLEQRSKVATSLSLDTLLALRRALTAQKTRIPEFMKRANAEVWPSVQTDAAEQGTCIYQLVMLLAAAESEERLTSFFNLIGAALPAPGMRLLTQIARDILST